MQLSRNVFAIFILIFSCTNNNVQSSREVISKKENKNIATEYVIKGNVVGMDTGEIYIARIDTNLGIPGKQRNAAAVKNGNFEFRGNINRPELIWLGLSHNGKPFFSYQFFLDTGELKMQLYKDSLHVSRASGNRSQDEYNEFNEKFYPALALVNKAWFETKKAEKRKDLRAADSLKVYYDERLNSMRQTIVDHAQTNPTSVVTAYLVTKNLLADPDPDMLTPIYNGFDSSLQNSFYGRQIWKAIVAGKKTMIGKLAPDFTLKDQDGKAISLSAYKGRFTLVDFWASWCGPCRAENPNLVNAYNEFKEKDFSILSISLDDNKKAWLKAVAQDKLPWEQVSDLKGSKSEVKETYGIKSIPMNYLLDREGRIIAKNLRGNQVQKKLRAVIK